jgi:hypothetical protein
MSVAAELLPRVTLSPDNPEVPWWAVWLLEMEKGTPEWYVRRSLDLGSTVWYVQNDLTNKGFDKPVNAVWDDIVHRALQLAKRFDPLDVARQEPQVCRLAALKSQRAFCEFTDLRDDEGLVIKLMGFHCRVIRTLRQNALVIALLPAFHGKSALSTIVIPLVDWAEQPESVQIRAYQTQKDFSVPMTRKLMELVENNQAIKVLFPAIRRPERGDPCEKMWSTNGFSIGGKKVVEYSFRAVTPGASTVGIRGDRIIADDWVTEKNCSTPQVQDRYFNWFHSGIMTMRRRTEWRSIYKTMWGTAGAVGTIYDRQDYLARLSKDWKLKIKDGDKTRKVLRFSVYPHRHSREQGEVLWPNKRPLTWVSEQENELGRRGFRMRYLNLPMEDEEVVFREQSVRDACSDEWEFAKEPPDSRVIIGYDPAKGGNRRSYHAKFPACVVLAFRKDPINEQRVYCHIVEWHRWNVSQPEQVRRLVEISRRYSSSVVVEDNATQKSYSEWIAEIAPDVRCINHTTGNVKHDVNDGVESFQPLFDNGLMVIHTRGAATSDVKALTEEWMEWPQGRYTDLVMACWMARYQYKKLTAGSRIVAAPVAAKFIQRIPGRYTVDLSAYR